MLEHLWKMVREEEEQSSDVGKRRKKYFFFSCVFAFNKQRLCLQTINSIDDVFKIFTFGVWLIENTKNSCFLSVFALPLLLPAKPLQILGYISEFGEETTTFQTFFAALFIKHLFLLIFTNLHISMHFCNVAGASYCEVMEKRNINCHVNNLWSVNEHFGQDACEGAECNNFFFLKNMCIDCWNACKVSRSAVFVCETDLIIRVGLPSMSLRFILLPRMQHNACDYYVLCW